MRFFIIRQIYVINIFKIVNTYFTLDVISNYSKIIKNCNYNSVSDHFIIKHDYFETINVKS